MTGCATSSATDRVAVTSTTAPARHVDLNEAGALEALRQSNPAHYEKIRRILEGILQQPETRVPRWLQVNFDARDVAYAPIVLTSHPPKRRLSFALDATRYEAIIVLTNVRGDIVPLR
jgi:hypothetical protein